MKNVKKLENLTQLKMTKLDAVKGGSCDGESWWGIAKWYYKKAKKVTKEIMN